MVVGHGRSSAIAFAFMAVVVFLVAGLSGPVNALTSLPTPPVPPVPEVHEEPQPCPEGTIGTRPNCLILPTAPAQVITALTSSTVTGSPGLDPSGPSVGTGVYVTALPKDCSLTQEVSVDAVLGANGSCGPTACPDGAHGSVETICYLGDPLVPDAGLFPGILGPPTPSREPLPPLHQCYRETENGNVPAVCAKETYVAERRHDQVPFQGGRQKQLCHCDRGESTGAGVDGSVNVVTGELKLVYAPATLPAEKGFPFALNMTHRTISPDATARDSMFGPKWDYNYGAQIRTHSSGDLIHYPGLGVSDRYTTDTVAGKWNSPLGLYSYIEDTDSTGNVKKLVDRHGGTQTYTKSGTVWKLTGMADNLGNSMRLWPRLTPADRTAVLDTQERLIYISSHEVVQYLAVDVHVQDEAKKWISEADFNTIVVPRFTTDPATLGEHPTNKVLPTDYETRLNTQNELEYEAEAFYTWTFDWSTGHWKIFDWKGLVVNNVTSDFGGEDRDYEILVRTLATFSYTGGVLTRIDSSSSDARFVYDGSSRVIAIADGNDRYYVHNTYDSEDRVAKQRYGYGDYTFNYNTPSNYTVVHDRNGNRKDFHYDESNGLVKRVVQWTNRDINAADPEAFVTTYTHNQHREVTSVTYPRLNSDRYEFDENNGDLLAQGNLLRKIRDPGPWKAGLNGEAQEPLVTEYTYTDKYNLVKTVTDSRGTSEYVPPNGGTNLNRYVTTYTYEHEEALLGDVNGDGITTRTGAALIKLEKPALNQAGLPMSDFSSAYASVARSETWQHTAFGQVLSHTDVSGQTQTWEYFPQLAPMFDPTDAAHFTSKSEKLDVELADGVFADLLTEYERDLDGNPTKLSDPEGNEVTLDWAPGCLLTRVKAPPPLHYETHISHDANGQVSEVERQMETGGDFTTSETIHDILGNPLKEIKVATRPAGSPTTLQDTTPVTLYCYDLNDNLVLTRRPESVNSNQFWDLESTIYDERDQAYSVTRGDILGAYWEQPLSPAGACKAPRTHPDPECQDPTGNYYTDDEINDPPFTTPPTPPTPGGGGPGGPTSTSYSVSPSPTPTRSPILPLPPLPSGAPTSVPTGLSSVELDEECGELESLPLAHGTINSTALKTYDANGNLKWSVDGRGYLTRTLYDGYDRSVATVDAQGGVSETTYDVVDNVIVERFCGAIHPHSPLAFLADTQELGAIGRLLGCISLPMPGAMQLYTERRTYHDEANQAYRADEWFQDTSTGLGLRDGAMTPEDGYTTSLTQYDAAGRVTRTVNDNRHAFNTVYNKLGWRMSTVDAVLNTQAWEYDLNGNAVVSMHTSVNPDGHISPRDYEGEAEYDALNRKTSTTNSDGGVRTSAYDGLGSKKHGKDEVGISKKQIHDGLQRLLLDRYTVYDYNTTEVASTLTTVDTEGEVVPLTVTWIGGVTGVKSVNFTDEVPVQRYYFADDADYELETVDGVTTVTGHLVTITHHVDYLNVTYDYDADGRLVSMKDGNGNPTAYAYDPLGRKIGEVFADGANMTYEHDKNDNVVRMVDANGNIVTHAYDSLNRLIETRVERGPDTIGTTRQTFRYDALGRQIESVDEETVPYAAPEPPTPLTATGGEGDGLVSGYAFESQHPDNLAPLAMDADDDGYVRITVLNPYYETSTGYEPAVGDFMVHLTGGGAPFVDVCSIAAGDTSCDVLVPTEWLFGVTNFPSSAWRVSVVLATNASRTSQYETSRNHAIFATSTGHQQFSLDSHAAEIDAMEAAGYPVASSQVVFVNLHSNRLPSIPKTYTVQRIHDSHGNVILETENGLTARSVYDGVGNRVKFTYPNGRIINSTYDPLERVKEIWDRATDHPEESLPQWNQLPNDPSQVPDWLDNRTQAWPGDAVIATYSYFGTQNVLRREYANGVLQYRDFDDAERVEVIAYTGHPTVTLPGFEYDRALDGSKLATRHYHDDQTSEAYEVDGLKRLTRFERGELSTGWVMDPAAKSQEWELDDANNWESTTSDLDGTTSTSERDHNSRNEITENDVDGTVTAYAYDANGNMVSDGSRQFSWDFKNRLREVRDAPTGSLIARMDYDAENRRVLRAVGIVADEAGEVVAAATATTYFLDGMHEVQEMDATGLVVRKQYVFGPQIDEVLVADTSTTGVLRVPDADERHYYLQNEMMSVHAILDSDKNVLAEYAYDPYGAHHVIGTDATGNELLYTGRRWDGDLALYYYRTRYMDPELGRFVSSDTIGVWGDAASLGNPFGYVSNNPRQNLDMMGTSLERSFGAPKSQLGAISIDMFIERERVEFPFDRTYGDGRQPDPNPNMNGDSRISILLHLEFGVGIIRISPTCDVDGCSEPYSWGEGNSLEVTRRSNYLRLVGCFENPRAPGAPCVDMDLELSLGPDSMNWDITHDGFPSYEMAWRRKSEQTWNSLYYHKEESPFSLYPPSEISASGSVGGGQQ